MMDMVLRISQLPERGGDAPVLERVLTTGGGFNIMSAAARQGVPVRYAGWLGQGPLAEQARASLENDGIALPCLGGTRDLGVCVVLLEADGERTFVTSPGAETDVTAAALQSIDIRTGDIAYFSGYNFLHDGVCEAVLSILTQLSTDVLVAFDPGPRVLDIPGHILSVVLARTDWLLINRDEFNNLIKARTQLTSAPRRGMVIHNGPEGCAVIIGSEIFHRPAPSVAAIDTNGAGDTHNGVFLASLLLGDEPLEAARRANVAAADAVTKVGPANSPTRSEIDRLLSH
jgi:sugar/nucleoside kinase (ribokinase family)